MTLPTVPTITDQIHMNDPSKRCRVVLIGVALCCIPLVSSSSKNAQKHLTCIHKNRGLPRKAEY